MPDISKWSFITLSNNKIIGIDEFGKMYITSDGGQLWTQIYASCNREEPKFIGDKTLDSLYTIAQSINHDNSENRIIRKLKEEGVL